LAPGGLLADGSETLGAPSIAVAEGSGIVAAGVGLIQAQPGTIDITVPPGATVNQVLLYWEGQMRGNVVGDASIVVNGNDVTGVLIGGPTLFFREVGGTDLIHSSAFRADITGLDLISEGPNSIEVGGLDFTFANNGAGILVVFDDGSSSDIQVRDGLDLAFWFNTNPQIKVTVAQTFSFAAAGFDRTATLSMFFSSVEGETSTGGTFRPNSIEVTVGGVTTVFSDILGSNDGEEWDTQSLDITVPAGETSLTAQAFSRNDSLPPAQWNNPLVASLGWVAAGLSVPLPEPCIDIEKLVSVDGGANFDDADECADAPATAWSAEYKLVVTNCGPEDLENVVIHDAALGITNFVVGNLAVGESVELLQGDIEELFFEDVCAEYDLFENLADVSGLGVVSGQEVTDEDPACVVCEEFGNEGCTPGYWKQEQHFASWVPTGYAPDDLFSDVFGIFITIKWSQRGRPRDLYNPSLLQALGANGGGINELARHGVAGLLSAAHPDVDYPYSVADVIAAVLAGDAGTLVEANELGCPLNGGLADGIDPDRLRRLAACGTTPSVPGDAGALNLGSLFMVFGAIMLYRKRARARK
jgi:hypothetical protein